MQDGTRKAAKKNLLPGSRMFIGHEETFLRKPVGAKYSVAQKRGSIENKAIIYKYFAPNGA